MKAVLLGLIATTITAARSSPQPLPCPVAPQDRKSTRLNSSHLVISYAVFCLKKKTLDIFNRLNVPIDPESRISDLTVAQQQPVEIANSITVDSRILSMHEPSASLTSQPADKL